MSWPSHSPRTESRASCANTWPICCSTTLRSHLSSPEGCTGAFDMRQVEDLLLTIPMTKSHGSGRLDNRGFSAAC